MAELLQGDDATGLRWLEPEWDAPVGVRACAMTRLGGHSQGQWSGLNVSTAVDDDSAVVAINRKLLVKALNLPSEPSWIDQVHGYQVIELESVLPKPVRADAVITSQPGLVCALVCADCLPVFFATDAGVVGLAHVGWRGLVKGILPAACDALITRSQGAPNSISAWLGPAIGPRAFEVGEDVYDAITSSLGDAARQYLLPGRDKAHWYANLYALARLQLTELGVHRVSGGDCCTHTQSELFFSYRRDGVTGRQANLIWLERGLS